MRILLGQEDFVTSLKEASKILERTDAESLSGSGKTAIFNYSGFSEAFYFCLQQGDNDNGGMVTADEAYEYANSLIINTNDPNYDGQHPVIYDSYQEDLILTEVEIPPDVPTIYDGVRIVNVGDSVSFSADSTLMQWSSMLTSAKRGIAPDCTTEKLLAINV